MLIRTCGCYTSAAVGNSWAHATVLRDTPEGEICEMYVYVLRRQ